MKKNLYKAMVPAIAIAISMTTGVFAQETPETTKPKIIYGTFETKESDFIQIKGTVLKVVFQDGMKRVMVKTEDGTLMAFNTYYYTPIFQYDKKITAPTEGDLVTVAYKKNAPMTASEPPQVNASSIVVMDSDNSFSVQTDDFDTTGLSKDGTKQLVLSENTVIHDLNGNLQKPEAIQNKTLMVYYSVETTTLPKRIIAKSILVLADKEPNREQAARYTYYYDKLPAEAKVSEGVANYVRLKDLADMLGMGLIWDGETQGLTLQKEGNVYQFRVGEKGYTDNQAEAAFYNAPKIIGDKIFIELDFALQLIAEYI